MICLACQLWNHWHGTPDGSCEYARCECPYRPLDAVKAPPGDDPGGAEERDAEH